MLCDKSNVKIVGKLAETEFYTFDLFYYLKKKIDKFAEIEHKRVWHLNLNLKI